MQRWDGPTETFNIVVKAATPDDAMEEAFQQFSPRYQGEGWRIVTVVDELRATDDEEES